MYYAAQRWGLRCRYIFYDLSAVIFVHRYVMQHEGRRLQVEECRVKGVGLEMLGSHVHVSPLEWFCVDPKFGICHV